MWAELPIQHVHFAPADAPPSEGTEHQHLGVVTALFAYVLIISGFRLVRRPNGRHSILFPTCRSKRGKVLRTVVIRSDNERREIERRLLDELRRQRVIP
jgi:hypothetical protein